MILSRSLTAVAVAAVLLAGCKKQQDTAAAPEVEPAAQAGDTTAAPSTEPAPAPAAAETAQPQAAAATGFDINAIAVSDKPLGEWPYVSAPQGYVLDSAKTFDLSRVPFWTGQTLEFVEGKVYIGSVIVPSDTSKSFSRFEMLKRIDEQLSALGAHKITTSKVPEDVIEKDLPEDFGSEFYAGAGGYLGNQEVSTYVIRQVDKVVWFKVFGDTNNGSLLIAETEPVPGTAAAAQ